MNWKNVRVVVTGAGGFIGSHLTEELARRGAKVRALVHYNSRGHWGFLEELDPALQRFRKFKTSGSHCLRRNLPRLR